MKNLILDKIFSLKNENTDEIKYKVITIFGIPMRVGSKKIDIRLQENKRSHQIIISLTSYPKRIKTASKTIETLMLQSYKADKIILWLAKDEFPNKEEDLPNDIIELKKKGLEICWCENLKSYKKLIPALKKYPNDIIVTADDDLLYDKKWLELLIKSYQKNPEVINAHRCHRINFKNNLYSISWNSYSPSKPEYNLFCTTGSGILYPPNVFSPEVFNSDVFMKICPTNDDLWFWAQAVLNNKKIQVIKGNIQELNCINGTQEDCLWEYNQDNTNEQLQNLLKYYPTLYKKLKRNSIYKDNNTFVEQIFSIKNKIFNANKYKVITILGIKIKFKVSNQKIVKQVFKSYDKVKQNIKEKFLNRQKIKVLFLIRETSKWSYDSLFLEMQKSDIFEPVIAVSLLTSVTKGIDKTRNDLDISYKFFLNLGYSVVKAYDETTKSFVDLRTFEPDIVFYDQPWELPKIHRPEEISKYVLTCYSPYSFVITNFEAEYTQNFHKLLFRYYLEHKTNIVRYEKLKKGNSNNCRVVGYPKLDTYLEQMQINLEKYWKNPNAIKIIYAPHHSFESDGLKLATFQNNGQFILNLAKQHPETTWVFKPHPRFKNALFVNNIMTKVEIDKYYNEWEKIGNIYDKGNYFDIFKSSDLMITDCDSFRAEYLPTTKPIINIIRDDSISLNLMGEKIVSSLYTVKNNDELMNVFNNLVVEKNDYKKEKRLQVLSEIFSFEEKSSTRIVNEILKSIKENK